MPARRLPSRPGLSEDVVAASAAAGLPFFPGVATADRDRATLVARGTARSSSSPPSLLGGTGVPRPAGGDLPRRPLHSDGRVTPPTLADYLAIPQVLACGGSWMVNERVAAGRGPSTSSRAEPARRCGGRVSVLERGAPPDRCRFDLVSLGEVMLRLDPGEGRIAHARDFRAWEGGGEYNVARGLNAASASHRHRHRSGRQRRSAAWWRT